MCAAPSIRYLFVLLLGVMTAVRSSAVDSNLLDNSPFLPPNVSGAAAAGVNPLELRSILKAGGEFEFSVYDLAKRQSTWVKLNEAGRDFVVKAYDPASDSVTVEQQSRTYKLVLKEVKIVPLAMVAPPNLPQSIAGSPQGAMPGGPRTIPGMPLPGMGRGTTPTGPMPTPTLTPEQLRNLEADINRRRELRRQAAASLAQPGQAQPAPTQPQGR